MPSYEAEVAAILSADATLMNILDGGVFTGAAVGIEGITRDTAAGAFDANGYLEPCALVRQRAKVPTGDVLDFDAKVESARQVVEVWLYDDPVDGYAELDTAAARVRTLLMGRQLTDSFELRLAQWLDRERDPGALLGASMQRLDWQVDFIQD